MVIDERLGAAGTDVDEACPGDFEAFEVLGDLSLLTLAVKLPAAIVARAFERFERLVVASEALDREWGPRCV